MADKKQWIVVTNGEKSLDEMANALEKKGFTINSKLEAIGQIIVSGTADAKNEALKLKGVSAIEPSLDINIGQPGSDLTW